MIKIYGTQNMHIRVTYKNTIKKIMLIYDIKENDKMVVFKLVFKATDGETLHVSVFVRIHLFIYHVDTVSSLTTYFEY